MSIPGMALKAIGGSKTKAAVGAVDGASKAKNITQSGKQKVDQARNRQNVPSLNKKKTPPPAGPSSPGQPSGPTGPQGQQMPNLAKQGSLTQRVHKTYDDMIQLEKTASPMTGGDKYDIKKGLMHAGITTGAGLAAMGAVRGAGALKKKMDTERAWKKLKQRRPELTESEEDRENFEVLQKFAPDIASNVTTLESYMERVSRQMMMPHEFIEDLTRTQDRIDQGGLGEKVEDMIPRKIDQGVSRAQKERLKGYDRLQKKRHFDRREERLKNASQSPELGGFEPKYNDEETVELDSLKSTQEYVEPAKEAYHKKDLASEGMRTASQLKEAMNKVDPRK